MTIIYLHRFIEHSFFGSEVCFNRWRALYELGTGSVYLAGKFGGGEGRGLLIYHNPKIRLILSVYGKSGAFKPIYALLSGNFFFEYFCQNFRLSQQCFIRPTNVFFALVLFGGPQMNQQDVRR